MYSLVVFLVVIGCAFGAAPNDRSSIILRQSSEIDPDGSYQWSYESDNGISAEERGSLNKQTDSLEAQGQFAYTAPDGTPIALQYIADENGFQPQGAHLPVAPPIPDYILRGLEWSRNHPSEDKRK